MNKAIGFLIGICAFLVALFYVTTKRNFEPNLSKDAPLLKRKFLATVAVLVTFLSTGKIFASANESDTQIVTTSEKGEQKIGQLKKFREWKQIKSNWQSVSKIERIGMDSMEKIINEKKKENWSFLSKLVSAGLLTGEGARVFNDIYADRIYHHLRPMAATCYEPTILGFRQQSIRDDIENRLKELAKLTQEGKVNIAVTDQAKRNLEKDMEIVLLINELWDRGRATNWGQEYYEEAKRLLSYFVGEGYDNAEIKDNLKIREDVKETLEIIQLLYSD